MKSLFIPECELWDEDKEEFIYVPEGTLEIEHSLISVSLWESKYERPFLSKDQKTRDELMAYIRFMTLNDVDDRLYAGIGEHHINEINAYIEKKCTATTIKKETLLIKANLSRVS